MAVFNVVSILIRGRGGTPVYRHVPPQRVWFLRCFGLKTGIDLAHVGLELRECMRKKKKEICLFEMDFNNYFLLPFLSNDDIISQRPGLNSGCEKGIFWSEIESMLENRTAHSQEFPAVPPGF